MEFNKCLKLIKLTILSWKSMILKQKSMELSWNIFNEIDFNVDEIWYRMQTPNTQSIAQTISYITRNRRGEYLK